MKLSSSFRNTLLFLLLVKGALAFAHNDGPDPIPEQEWKKVPTELRERVRKQDPNAYFEIARYFEKKQETKQDSWTVANWYLRAADNSGEKNSRIAWAWIEKAAVSGNAAAQYFVYGNRAVLQKPGGYDELRSSAKQGYPEAMRSLGEDYLGSYVGISASEDDYKKAAFWLRKAAITGDVIAMNQLAIAYGRKFSPIYNELQSLYFLLIGKRLGSSFANDNLKTLSHLVEQRQDIVAHASKWKPGSALWNAPTQHSELGTDNTKACTFGTFDDLRCE